MVHWTKISVNETCVLLAVKAYCRPGGVDLMIMADDLGYSYSKRFNKFHKKVMNSKRYEEELESSKRMKAEINKPIEFRNLEDLKKHKWFGSHAMDYQAFIASENLFAKYMFCGRFKEAEQVIRLSVEDGMGIEVGEIYKWQLIKRYEMGM